MVKTKKTNKEQKSNFAYNWMDNMDTIMQLVLSGQIWKKYKQHPDKQVIIEKKVFQPEQGLIQTVFYLDDEPIMMHSKSLGTNPEIPMHYTLVI